MEWSCDTGDESLATVRFAMDRAGLVGADGATHCGAFDITYMAQVCLRLLCLGR